MTAIYRYLILLSCLISFQLVTNGALAAESCQELYQAQEQEQPGIVKQTFRFSFREDKDAPYFFALREHYNIDATNRAHIESEIQKHLNKTGPAIVTMNHPMSGLEVIIMADIISQYRPGDAKVVMMSPLKLFPGMKKHAFFVGSSPAMNQVELAKAANHLAAGKVLIICPSGAISGKSSPDQMAEDPTWKTGTARLIRSMPSAQVLPVRVLAELSSEYYAVEKQKTGYSRYIFLIQEMSKFLGEHFEFRTGETMYAGDLLEHFEITPKPDVNQPSSEAEKAKMTEMMSALRGYTYQLK